MNMPNPYQQPTGGGLPLEQPQPQPQPQPQFLDTDAITSLVGNQFHDVQGEPQYDETIASVLTRIQSLLAMGDNVNIDVQTKGVYQLAQAAHYLAQASVQEGQHVPASINLRMESMKMENEQQQQQHQQHLAVIDQQHRHQLEKQLNDARVAQLKHAALLNEFKTDMQHNQGVAGETAPAQAAPGNE
jgi:uncharacterized protein YicC (UPF0701 family)